MDKIEYRNAIDAVKAYTGKGVDFLRDADAKAKGDKPAEKSWDKGQPQACRMQMLTKVKLPFAIWATVAFLTGCGGMHMPPATVTGITVQPGTPTIYSEDAPPKNQVSFAAYETFSDGSIGANPIGGTRWTYDFASWVFFSGNAATCTQPAPVVIFPFTSTITATSKIGGTTYTATAALTCL
jgi:hypothetical protein